MTVTGDALEVLVQKHLQRIGYRVHRARASLEWRGTRGRCRRCHKVHPSCGSRPQSRAHDLWGCVDLIGFSRGGGWVVCQCGPASQAAKKRAALDGECWPEETGLMVVTPDSRKSALPGVYRAWRRRADEDEWDEGRLVL